MISKLTNKGYFIRTSSIDGTVLNSIKEELTIEPNGSDYNEDIKEVEAYQETENHIVIPRFYGIKRFGIPSTVILNGREMRGEFIGDLKESQKGLVNKAINQLDKYGGGILSVGCGQGKTVMGLYLACRYKLKTLVLVHKSFLQDQWIERAKQFTNAKIGIIRQNKLADKDCDIVIGMVQSITSRDYDRSVFKDFGFLICDEAHHYASPKFSQVFYKCSPKYILGLSATPIRKDGLTIVLKHYLGEIFYRQKVLTNRQVICKLFYFRSKDKRFREILLYNKFKREKCPSHVKMINNLVELESRNNLIVNIINYLRKFPERKILILSGRVDHLIELKKRVDLNINEDIDKGLIEKEEIKTYYYVGKVKKKERVLAEDEGDILFGTYEMADEGLDIPRLNTIILATPKRNNIQSIGRIMRKTLKDGDERPLIIDICDELSIFKSQAKERINNYQKRNYLLNKYYVKDNHIQSPKEYIKDNMNVNSEEAEEFIRDNPEYDYINNLENIFNLDKVKEEDENNPLKYIEIDPDAPNSEDEDDNYEKINNKKDNKNIRNKKSNKYNNKNEIKKEEYDEYLFDE